MRRAYEVGDSVVFKYGVVVSNISESIRYAIGRVTRVHYTKDLDGHDAIIYQVITDITEGTAVAHQNVIGLSNPLAEAFYGT